MKSSSLLSEEKRLDSLLKSVIDKLGGPRYSKGESDYREKLLQTAITEVKRYAEDQSKNIKQLTQIGLALSMEKDLGTLLEKIVTSARELTNADAGTLYIIDKAKSHLRFEIIQNETLNTYIGGKTGVQIALPLVPLYANGKPNFANVSSYVAITGQPVNIPNVYQAEGFDFTGPRNYDASTGYQSQSMLVVPMKNYENDIIGVLQLLNAQDPDDGRVIAFSPEYVDLVASLASQAAVALTNTQLIQELKNLFNAFIKSIATAIDEKSPYTGGHIRRVVDLTMMIANEINRAEQGPFKDVQLTDSEIEELRLAAWMHDVGKITTPEYVINKATKLETIFDRTHIIEHRFKLIAQSIENSYLKEKIALLQQDIPDLEAQRALDAKFAADTETLAHEAEFIKSCNTPVESMDDKTAAEIRRIGSKTCCIDGEEEPYLTPGEIENLCIRKGTLVEEERKVIENHARMTLKILEQLPFPKHLMNVPIFACGHHEKLDGSGYPLGLKEHALPLQTRILAVADIFEALTAQDRPYKEPLNLAEAVEIMGQMMTERHIDPDIYELFIQSGIFFKYAHREMNPMQINDQIPDLKNIAESSTSAEPSD